MNKINENKQTCMHAHDQAHLYESYWSGLKDEQLHE